jgi:subtilisin family serine protease
VKRLPFASFLVWVLPPLLLLVGSMTTVFASQSAPPEPIVRVIVELSDPPLTRLYAERRALGAVAPAALAAATQAQLAIIEVAQQHLLAHLAEMEAQVLFRNQRVYNGIAVVIKASQRARLTHLAGVKAVHPLTHKWPLNSRSVPLLGAPALWQGGNNRGLTGAGITIAIIDTGIDYLHTDFGGPGTGYGANDPLVAGDVPGFPSAKIIGGYDFTGDAYNADPDAPSYNPLLTPDPDPMDCYPHGTGVAATAAGYGVRGEDRTTYLGPYDTNTPFNQLEIGPGVAPLAQLYALKVFGCTGSSEVVDMAIEWAVDPNGDGDLSDQVDVINLSLGSAYGSLHDMTAVASANAVDAGVIVVAAAGNSGDTTYVSGSPAVANQVISVAASQPLLGVYEVGNEGVASFSSRGPRRFDSALKPDLAAPGFDIFTANQGSGGGGRFMSGTSFAAPHVAGALALLHQLHPTWSPAELKALVINTAMSQLRTSVQITSPVYAPMRIGAGRIDLTKAIQSNTVVYNAAEAGLVNLSFGVPEVVGKSSFLKQVRVANKGATVAKYVLSYTGVTDTPGVDISLPMTTVQVEPGGVVDLPLVLTVDGGVLRRQRDVTLSPLQVGETRAWLSEESGYLLLWPTSGPFTTVLRSPPTSFSPGGVALSEATLVHDPATHTLGYIVDLRPFTSTVTAVVIGQGAAKAVNTAHTLFLNNGGQAHPPFINGVVTLNGVDEQMLANDLLYLNVSTVEQGEVAGRGQLYLPAPVLKAPVYAAPRPAAALQVVESQLDLAANLRTIRPLTLTGHDLQATQPPTDVLPLVSALALHASSRRLPADHQLARYAFADLYYVGATSNLTTTHLTTATPEALVASTLYFGIATYENWSTPNEVEFSILIDREGDGVDDYRLFNANLAGYQDGRGRSDVFITALEDLRTGQISRQALLNGRSLQEHDMALFNSRVMLLPVRAQALELNADWTGFFYRVESYSDDLAVDANGQRQVIDQSPRLRFDLVKDSVNFSTTTGPSPIFVAQEGQVIQAAFQLSGEATANVAGVLLLHHHNLSTQRAQVVWVDYSRTYTRYLPFVQGQ